MWLVLWFLKGEGSLWLGTSWGTVVNSCAVQLVCGSAVLLYSQDASCRLGFCLGAGRACGQTVRSAPGQAQGLSCRGSRVACAYGEQTRPVPSPLLARVPTLLREGPRELPALFMFVSSVPDVARVRSKGHTSVLVEGLVCGVRVCQHGIYGQ